MSDEQTNEQDDKVPHHRAPNFASHFATGVVYGAVGSANNEPIIQMVFYEEAMAVKTETMEYSDEEKSSFKTKLSDDDLIAFREDKVRISMPNWAARSMYDMLKRHFEDEVKNNPKEEAES